MDEREYAVAKDLDPKDPTPWLYDAIAKQTTNRPVEALHDMQQTMARSEWLWPGKLLLSQRRYDEAIKIFQEALTRVLAHPSLHWALGEALCGVRRYAEARPHLQAGLVADDVTRITMLEGRELMATAPDLTRNHMEVRGIGIIDVAKVFGIGSIRVEKRLDLEAKIRRRLRGESSGDNGSEGKNRAAHDGNGFVEIRDREIP